MTRPLLSWRRGLRLCLRDASPHNDVLFGEYRVVDLPHKVYEIGVQEIVVSVDHFLVSLNHPERQEIWPLQSPTGLLRKTKRVAELERFRPKPGVSGFALLISPVCLG